MVVSIINNKGGVAKTTTTIHLGAYLAKKKKKVLMIDFDSQCNLSARVNANNINYNIVDFLNGKKEGFALAKSKNSELYTLRGSEKLDIYQLTPNVLKESLESIKNVFDFILIDCQPSLLHEELLTTNEVALIASDAVIVPVNADMASISGVHKLLMAFNRIKNTTNPNLNVLGVVFTAVFEKEQLFLYFYNEFKNKISNLIFNSYIRKNVDIQKSETKLTTIFEYNPQSSGAEDYANFGDEFLKRIKNLKK